MAAPLDGFAVGACTSVTVGLGVGRDLPDPGRWAEAEADTVATEDAVTFGASFNESAIWSCPSATVGAGIAELGKDGGWAAAGLTTAAARAATITERADAGEAAELLWRRAVAAPESRAARLTPADTEPEEDDAEVADAEASLAGALSAAAIPAPARAAQHTPAPRAPAPSHLYGRRGRRAPVWCE